MTRALREAFTLAVVVAGLSQVVHLMLVGLALIDPSRVPQ